jgi:sulfonate transport system permease protein
VSLLDHRSARLAVGLVAPAALLIWWQSQASQGGANAVAFASLGTIGSAARELIANGTLPADVAATLRHTFTGLAIGATLGVALGMAMAMVPLLDRLLGPLLNALRQVPMIGWLPLIGLWFGSDEDSELIVICLSAFFPAMLNAHAGVAQVERRYLEVGRIYGFTTSQRFRLILLPAAMPLLLTGLTQALAFAWIAAIGFEILMGTNAGLGVTMQQAQTQQRLDIILVVIAVTAVLGFTINQIVRRLRSNLLAWQAPAL